MVVLQHWHSKQCAYARVRNACNGKRGALFVSVFHHQIGDLNHLLCSRDTAESGPRRRSKWCIRTKPCVSFWRIMHGHHAVSFVFVQEHVAKISSTDTDGILKHRGKYWLQITGRS